MKRLSPYLCLFLLPLLALECEEEDFTPDPDNSGLPAYTEKGANIWGAMVDDVVYRSSIDCNFYGCNSGMYMQNIYYQDTSAQSVALISFSGYKPGFENEFIQINFYLGTTIPPYGFYEEFQGVRFDLSDSSSFAEIDSYLPYSDSSYCTISKNGYLQFNRFDETESTYQYHNLHAAGTFEFYIENDSCSNVRVEKGRFDFDFIR
ncbi:hypothetical protein QWY31_12215 [Cytophagales bacterium LB-30]|uniref:Lipoprotein n=1 Tax=Shiella aurantiaca TaxID=3058365 RepID=A0ABT8F733_9BACT|nr:hypothetical protein [Shiella aurantiaca]MDN4166270.1 hypothetical protein [Shiella aurantiaca]